MSDIGKNLDVWTTQQREEANKIEKYIRDGTGGDWKFFRGPFTVTRFAYTAFSWLAVFS